MIDPAAARRWTARGRPGSPAARSATIVTSRTITNCARHGQGDDHAPGLPGRVTLKHAYAGNTDGGHDAPRRRPPRARARQHDLRQVGGPVEPDVLADARGPRDVRAARRARPAMPRCRARARVRARRASAARGARRRCCGALASGARARATPAAGDVAAASRAFEGAARGRAATRARPAPGWRGPGTTHDPLAPVHRLAHAGGAAAHRRRPRGCSAAATRAAGCSSTTRAAKGRKLVLDGRLRHRGQEAPLRRAPPPAPRGAVNSRQHPRGDRGPVSGRRLQRAERAGRQRRRAQRHHQELR